MALIVCQVISERSDQLTFTWSDGTNPFEPYSLSRLQLEAFREAVRTARTQLAELVRLHLSAPVSLELQQEAGHALAMAGHRLHQAVFTPEAEQQQRADNVRTWLAALNE